MLLMTHHVINSSKSPQVIDSEPYTSANSSESPHVIDDAQPTAKLCSGSQQRNVSARKLPRDWRVQTIRLRFQMQSLRQKSCVISSFLLCIRVSFVTKVSKHSSVSDYLSVNGYSHKQRMFYQQILKLNSMKNKELTRTKVFLLLILHCRLCSVSNSIFFHGTQI